MSTLWHVGAQYQGPRVDPTNVAADPIVQFADWFRDAQAAACVNLNVMTLATVGADGTPDARLVLLKGFDDGFVFYTNYQSKKGQDLDARAAAALVFYWHELHRQVRVRGTVSRVTADESDAYFAVRPEGSQVSALASPQSREITAAELDRRCAEASAASRTRPAHWGGYRVKPSELEFWQGQDSRLHDRVLYRRRAEAWDRVRLAP